MTNETTNPRGSLHSSFVTRHLSLGTWGNEMRVKGHMLWIAVLGVCAFAFQVARKPATPEDPLIAGFKQTTVASVSDAVDQVVGERGFLSHDMRPVIPGRVVGRAATALVRPATPDKATPALAVKQSVEIIDNATAGEDGVIVMEGTLDDAAIRGLMGIAAKPPGIAGP